MGHTVKDCTTDFMPTLKLSWYQTSDQSRDRGPSHLGISLCFVFGQSIFCNSSTISSIVCHWIFIDLDMFSTISSIVLQLSNLVFHMRLRIRNALMIWLM